MTTLCLPYYELSPAVFNPMKQALHCLENGPLANELIELVFLRISQINGCAIAWSYIPKNYANQLYSR